MSDQSQGPGWWQASDGRWYAPELHRDFVPPSRVIGPPGITAQVAPSHAQPPEDTVIGGPGGQLAPPHVPRRWWVWALPVVAGGLALAIVLPLTLGGASKKTPVAPQSSTQHTGLTGSYIATASGPQPLFLTLVQSGTSISGTLIVVGATTTPPERLTDTSTKFTGTVEGSKLTLVIRGGGQSYSVTGSISATSVSVDFGLGENVDFKRGTMAQFNQLVSRDRQSLLAQGDSVSDRAAQSNLVNALTEAKALYQITQAYASANGQPYGVQPFNMQAPEFTWTAGPCSAASENCISIQVLDLASEHDSQGIALTAYSKGTSTCWYAVDLETNPTVITNDASAFQSTAGGPNSSVTTAGVYYARSPAGSAVSSCSASLVLHAHHAAWGSDFSSAGGVG